MDVRSAQTPPADEALKASETTAAAPNAQSKAEANPPARKRRRWRWMVLVALLIGFIFLPQIVAATSLRNWVVAKVYPELPNGVTVRSATFAWWEPIMLAGVEVPDDLGRPMLMVEHITTDSTLWNIAVLGNNPGHIDIEHPQMLLRVSETGTNLDPTLARLKERSSRTPQAVEVHITDANVEILAR